MAAVHLICGKICCGKSTFARKLAREKNAVILSCDEIMTLFPQPEGDEAYAAVSQKVKACLMNKAAEIAACGANVILDWGFWLKAERQETAAFFSHLGIFAQWYYLDIPEDVWRQRIARRNAAPGASDYYVDGGLLQKCVRRFEAPDEDETENWIIQK
ncbi:MAG: ATP-binding protein [Clostridia bacterium]|nr:ATP-binding protein [Clostridia bacterium]